VQNKQYLELVSLFQFRLYSSTISPPNLQTPFFSTGLFVEMVIMVHFSTISPTNLQTTSPNLRTPYLINFFVHWNVDYGLFVIIIFFSILDSLLPSCDLRVVDDRCVCFIGWVLFLEGWFHLTVEVKCHSFTKNDFEWFLFSFVLRILFRNSIFFLNALFCCSYTFLQWSNMLNVCRCMYTYLLDKCCLMNCISKKLNIIWIKVGDFVISQSFNKNLILLN